MNLTPVQSRSIRAIGYDGRNLAVVFHSSNTVYLHPGVPPTLVFSLLRARSIGAFYATHIRGRYR